MDWRKHIHRDPQVLGGKPVIRGTRISVESVLHQLSGDWTVEDVLEACPELNETQVRACIAFAADALNQEVAPTVAHEAS